MLTEDMLRQITSKENQTVTGLTILWQPSPFSKHFKKYFTNTEQKLTLKSLFNYQLSFKDKVHYNISI